MAQEGYGSGAGGWKAPTPTNSDYQVSPVVMGAIAPNNTPVSPFQGRAIILPGDPSRLPRRLTPVRSDILDDLESNAFQLQRQNMNTSARLEFSTSNSSVDASSNESRSSSRKVKKSPLKSPCAGCPGRQCSSQKKGSAKKCQARQEDSSNASRRRSTPKNPSRKSLKGYRGPSPRYHPNGTQRPDWLDARQAEVIAAANAKRISGNGGGNDSYVAPPISPEKPRGHFVKVPSFVLYRAIQKVQAELFLQKCLGGPSSEEKRRKALGSPIPFDLNDASGVFCSPLPQQEKTPKNNGSKSAFIASGAETDPQKSRQIPWNQRQPKNLVRGLSHQWKLDHPGWETGKYRLNLDSTTSETSVEAAPAVESRSQSLPPGGVHNNRRSSRPSMSRRELVEGFLKYQKEVLSRQNNN